MPVHSVIFTPSGPQCTCGKPTKPETSKISYCSGPGKHPRLPEWQKIATTQLRDHYETVVLNAQRANSRCDSPMDEDEVRQFVESAFKQDHDILRANAIS